jgi:hypothetical protein
MELTVRGPSGSTQPAPRGTMLLIGAGPAVGFVCAAVAALQPSLSSVWTTSSTQAVTLIAGERSDAWRLANRMFGIGIWFTLAGLARWPSCWAGAPAGPCCPGWHWRSRPPPRPCGR